MRDVHRQPDINHRGRLRDSLCAIVPFSSHFPQRSVAKTIIMSQCRFFPSKWHIFYLNNILNYLFSQDICLIGEKLEFSTSNAAKNRRFCGLALIFLHFMNNFSRIIYIFNECNEKNVKNYEK